MLIASVFKLCRYVGCGNTLIVVDLGNHRPNHSPLTHRGQTIAPNIFNFWIYVQVAKDATSNDFDDHTPTTGPTTLPTLGDIGHCLCTLYKVIFNESSPECVGVHIAQIIRATCNGLDRGRFYNHSFFQAVLVRTYSLKLLHHQISW